VPLNLIKMQGSVETNAEDQNMQKCKMQNANAKCKKPLSFAVTPNFDENPIEKFDGPSSTNTVMIIVLQKSRHKPIPVTSLTKLLSSP